MMTWAGSMTRGRLLHLHRCDDDILRGDLRALYLAWLASAARSAGMGDEATSGTTRKRMLLPTATS